MKEPSLVSVIMPTYNNSSFLEKAISSITVDQAYPRVELIVVDDFSTNEIREKLIDLQSKYPFKLILLKENSGSCSRPLNEGLKVAQGKYIALCAQDDYFLPEKLSSQVSFL